MGRCVFFAVVIVSEHYAKQTGYLRLCEHYAKQIGYFRLCATLQVYMYQSMKIAKEMDSDSSLTRLNQNSLPSQFSHSSFCHLLCFFHVSVTKRLRQQDNLHFRFDIYNCKQSDWLLIQQSVRFKCIDTQIFVPKIKHLTQTETRS